MFGLEQQFAGSFSGWGDISNPYTNFNFSCDARVENLFIDGEEVGTVSVLTDWNEKRESIFMQGELKYRLLGICPVTPDVYTMNSEDPDFIELFWVFFPDARETLYSAKAFNEKNTSMPISFDQILNSRRFNSVIYKEENVYGDRDIKDYMKDNAQNQLLESDRIKDKIRSFEQDMWNY